jgi:hypothetical protein
MTTTQTRRVTRMDREEAAAAAGSVDLRPAGRVIGLIAVVLALMIAAMVFVPDPTRFGGPLQDGNVVSGATMTTVRKAGDGVVTIGVFVPWNTGGGTAVLEQISPLQVEGDVEMVKASLLPAGLAAIEPTRGFPVSGPSIVKVEEAPIPPGSGELDTVQIAVSLQGDGSVLAFLLRYRVGGATHHAILMSGVMVCKGACEDRSVVAERQAAFAKSVVGFVDAPAR